MPNQYRIQNVNGFTYLGSIISDRGGCKDDIGRRFNTAQVPFCKLKKICAAKELSLNSKIKTIVLYSCESWSASTVNIKRLHSMDNRCFKMYHENCLFLLAYGLFVHCYLQVVICCCKYLCCSWLNTFITKSNQFCMFQDLSKPPAWLSPLQLPSGFMK